MRSGGLVAIELAKGTGPSKTTPNHPTTHHNVTIARHHRTSPSPHSSSDIITCHHRTSPSSPSPLHDTIATRRAMSTATRMSTLAPPHPPAPPHPQPQTRTHPLDASGRSRPRDDSKISRPSPLPHLRFAAFCPLRNSNPASLWACSALCPYEEGPAPLSAHMRKGLLRSLPI